MGARTAQQQPEGSSAQGGGGVDFSEGRQGCMRSGAPGLGWRMMINEDDDRKAQVGGGLEMES